VTTILFVDVPSHPKLPAGAAAFLSEDNSMTDQAARSGDGATVASARDQSGKSDSTIGYEAKAGGIDLTLRAALSKRNSKAKQ
jgi:hypothetical protein